jgi:GT2 family glycosyltransferase
MENPIVTLVVVPRERFSLAIESLESIYNNTNFPFHLVYVDGNSPEKVKKYLDNEAARRNFDLVRSGQYLSPNHARNIGLSYVDAKYLVFIDNDVIVSPGWLDALIKCANETGASVVGPLMCEGEPVHQKIHFAGGESKVITDVKGRRLLREKMYRQGQMASDACPCLKRAQVTLAEFHCVLVRTEIFKKIGKLDEEMLNTKEHLDFCMAVAETGGSIYFEPSSLVTYVPGPPIDMTDVYYYMLRWSNAWTLRSLTHLREKWNLQENTYFTSKYKKLGWRRKRTIIRPLSRFLSFGFNNKPLRGILGLIDVAVNHYIVSRYARRFSARPAVSVIQRSSRASASLESQKAQYVESNVL